MRWLSIHAKIPGGLLLEPTYLQLLAQACYGVFTHLPAPALPGYPADLPLVTQGNCLPTLILPKSQ